MRDLLIVCSTQTGDLFRVFPDGRAREITERMLAHPDELIDLESLRIDTELFRSECQGDTFRVCAFVPCSRCNGTRVVRRDTPHLIFNEWILVVCDDCRGTGGSYSLTTETIASRGSILRRLAEMRGAA